MCSKLQIKILSGSGDMALVSIRSVSIQYQLLRPHTNKVKRNPIVWQGFWDQFRTSIDENDENDDRFNYLKRYFEISSLEPVSGSCLYRNGNSQNSLNKKCIYCYSDGHLASKCTFVSNVKARLEIIKKRGRCFLCLNKGHLLNLRNVKVNIHAINVRKNIMTLFVRAKSSQHMLTLLTNRVMMFFLTFMA